ncbi:hypothetical protein Tco_0415376 [Tanacetum coccineum]
MWKSCITPVDLEKPLVKDGDADDVDVHLYRSMIANLDRKSTTRGCQFLGNRLISWQCKKQTVVATSTTEAEYAVGAIQRDWCERNAVRMVFDSVWWWVVCGGWGGGGVWLWVVGGRGGLNGGIGIMELGGGVGEVVEHEESVPTPSNDPQPSGEDSMQLTDLMVLCTKLKTQVLDLQKAKDAQAKEIAAWRKRIQRLERRKMSRPTSLKRYRKVGMSQRVESSEDQESFGIPEDASKQGKSIEDIDVSLVDETQERQNDNLMFDSGVLEDDVMHVEAKVDGKDKQSKKPDDSTAGEAVTTAGIGDSAIPTTNEEQLQDPRIKGWLFRSQLGFLSTGKQRKEGRIQRGIAKEAKKDAWKKKEQERTPTESSRKQKVEEEKESEEDDEVELKKLLVIKKDEDIAIDAIPLATKLPVIIDYKLHKEGMLNTSDQLIRQMEVPKDTFHDNESARIDREDWRLFGG